jgi:hypothetical protein
MSTMPPERARLSEPEPHQQRQVAQPFGADPERYDRTRPVIPTPLVGTIVIGSPRPDVAAPASLPGSSKRLAAWCSASSPMRGWPSSRSAAGGGRGGDIRGLGSGQPGNLTRSSPRRPGTGALVRTVPGAANATVAAGHDTDRFPRSLLSAVPTRCDCGVLTRRYIADCGSWQVPYRHPSSRPHRQDNLQVRHARPHRRYHRPAPARRDHRRRHHPLVIVTPINSPCSTSS